MPNKKVFLSIGNCRTSEVDRAFHRKRTSECELDRAVHVRVKRAARVSPANSGKMCDMIDTKIMKNETTKKFIPRAARVAPVDFEKICDKDDVKIMKNETSKKSIPPSERYELRKFEQKYRAFVAAETEDKGALVDDVYHDEVVHMMDGVPMNKAALKNLCLDLEAHGTKRSVREFEVIDGSHVQSVIHAKNEQMQFYAKSLMTLKEGKIYRVEKIESAIPA